jgi:pilus assembly protein FimV
MRLPLSALMIATSVWLVSLPASALNVARTSNATVLGQTLDFTATIRLDGDETLRPECVQADVALGERTLPGQAVRVQLDGVGAERRARVRTNVAVDEPIVTVTLKIGCPVQFTRSFVAFVDPPGISLAQATPAPAPSASEPSPTPAASAPSAASPVTTLSGAASPSPAPSTRAEPSTADRAANASSVVRVPANRTAPPQPPRDTAERRAQTQPRVSQARPPPASRLQLDPVAPSRAASAPRPGPPTVAAGAGPAVTPPAPTQEPAAPAAVPTPAPAVAAASAPTPAASAPTTTALTDGRSSAEDEALRQLEQSLTAMRNEALMTQRSVAILQARLAQAEAERLHNPIVYALAAAVALLALGLLFVVIKLRQVQNQRAWWQQSTAEPLPGKAGAATTQIQGEPETRFMNSTTSTQPAAATAFGSLTTSSMGLTAAAPEDKRPAASAPAPFGSTAESRREVTVEELIDLEQQAEFFIVLGQDDAAIDVLMGHLRSSGGATPLPYLKLLEIYRRRDDREAYERIRERFNRRFNAYAPSWGNDLQLGRTLEDYPAAISRLQVVWPNPESAMELLEESLLRGEEAVGTFDLPAYREVLFLYSVARDIAERMQPDTVDLLLPITDGPGGRRPAVPPTDFGDSKFGDSVAGEDTATKLERRGRYESDFQFDSSGFISNNSVTPPKRSK